MITLNPAIQLGIDKRTGSIEQGKDADIVIWTAHPFSPYSRPDVTMIEGEVYFDRQADLANRQLIAKNARNWKSSMLTALRGQAARSHGCRSNACAATLTTMNMWTEITDNESESEI